MIEKERVKERERERGGEGVGEGERTSKREREGGRERARARARERKRDIYACKSMVFWQKSARPSALKKFISFKVRGIGHFPDATNLK